MTSVTCNQCVGSATAENKTGLWSELTGETSGSNKRAPLENGWGIEAVLELDRRALENMNKPKHRAEWQRYSLGVWRAYALNQWRFFIRPKWRRAWLELLVKFETRKK